MKKALFLTLISAVSASAQMTGDFGMMWRDGMMTYSPLWLIFKGAFALGLLLLVWLWVIKLWKEVRRMK